MERGKDSLQISKAEKIFSLVSPSIKKLRYEYEETLSLQLKTLNHLSDKENEIEELESQIHMSKSENKKLLEHRAKLMTALEKTKKTVQLKQEELQSAKEKQIKTAEELTTSLESFRALDEKTQQEHLESQAIIKEKEKSLSLMLVEYEKIKILLSESEMKIVDLEKACAALDCKLNKSTDAYILLKRQTEDELKNAALKLDELSIKYDDLNDSFEETKNDLTDKKSELAILQSAHLKTDAKLKEALDSYQSLQDLQEQERIEYVENIEAIELKIKKIRERYKNIRNNNGLKFFEVVVLATMSAGKSTLINALIGHELLPASNEACTARVFKIENDDFQEDFIASILDANCNKETSWVEACPKKLTELNTSNEKGAINIKGNIKSIETTGAELIIYDTPGPNNSQDDMHGKVTKNVLHDGNFGLVIYVMNATQFGVEDDAKLLTEFFGHIKSDLEKKEVIFVLNKAEQFDTTLGESLDGLVVKAESYLQGLGFKSAKIFPVSAMAALLARKSLNEQKLTRKEKRNLSDLIEVSKEAEKKLYEHSNLTQADKINLKNDASWKKKMDHDLSGVIEYSGITAIEYFIKNKLKTI